MQCGEHFLREAEAGVVLLTDSREEESAFVADQDAPMSRTRSDKQYLKHYDKAVASLSKPAKEAAKQPTKQLLEKQKELHYTKALRKGNAEGSSTFFALMSWLSWPTFQPELPSMSS